MLQLRRLQEAKTLTLTCRSFLQFRKTNVQYERHLECRAGIEQLSLATCSLRKKEKEKNKHFPNVIEQEHRHLQRLGPNRKSVLDRD